MFQAMELCHSGKRCSARPAVGSTLQHGEALYPVMLKASKGRTGRSSPDSSPDSSSGEARPGADEVLGSSCKLKGCCSRNLYMR